MSKIKLSRETRIGLFATLCIAALIWGINFLKGRNLFSPNNTYYAWFNTVDGLLPTNNVVVNGFKVGTVHSIDFDDIRQGRFLVTLLVNKKYPIPQNTVASLASDGLLGGKIIKLDIANTNAIHAAGDTLATNVELGMLDQFAPLKQSAESLLAEVQQLIGSLNSVLDERNRQQLSQSIEGLNHTLRHANSVATSLDNQLSANGSLSQSLANIESISSNLKGRNADIERMLSNLAAVSDTLSHAQLGNTLASLNASLRSLETTLNGLNNGQGSMGRLMTDDSLYIGLSRAAQQLDLLLKNINENPKKYMRLSVF